MSPAGRRFTQREAERLADLDAFTLVCGRYEGFDARLEDSVFDELLSVGDVVLQGGELAALLVIEAVVRLVPHVLGNTASAVEESFGAEGLLEYPQYTRPRSFEGLEVPRCCSVATTRRWLVGGEPLRSLERYDIVQI